MKSSQIRDRLSSKMKERDNRKTEWEKIKHFSFLSIILFCSLTSISMDKSLFWKKTYNLTIASSKLDFTELKQTANLSIWNKTCKIPDGAIFHKKHKTGSTSFQKMMRRYHQLRGTENIIEQPHMIYSTGCYPAKFNKKCWKGAQRRKNVIGMVDHFTWDEEYMPNVFGGNRNSIKVFTTVRDPLATFRSAYNFFYLEKDKELNTCEVICWGAPFKQIVEQSKRTFNTTKPNINEFLQLLPGNFNTSHPWNFRVRNLQSFELGLPLEKMNDNAFVKNHFETLDQQFDLVLILEYFYEGIVLLKHMLCCEYHHLYIEKTNSREYEHLPLETKSQKVFDKFFETDKLMYQYFNASLFRKIEAFGEDKMRIEKKKAQIIFQKCKEKKMNCNDAHFPKTHISENIKTPHLKLSEFIEIMSNATGHCDNPLSHFRQAKLLYEKGTWDLEKQQDRFCKTMRNHLLTMELDTKVPVKINIG